MKSIFRIKLNNIDAQSGDISFDNVTLKSLCFEEGSQNQDLLFTNPDGCIEGLALGTQDDVLTSDNNQLTWKNTINVNGVTTNSLTINNTNEGDILVFDQNNQANAFPRANTPGLILTSINSFPYMQWQPLVFPDPLILNDLQVNNNLNTFGVVNFNSGNPQADVSFAVPTFFNNNNISITAPNSGLYLLNNQVKYLNQFTYLAPNTGAIAGGVIGVPTSPWVMDPTVQYVASVCFCVQVGSTPFNKDNDIMIFELRNGFNVLADAQLEVGVPFRSVFLRAFITAPSVSLQLSVSARPGSDASTTANLRNITFHLKPTL